MAYSPREVGRLLRKLVSLLFLSMSYGSGTSITYRKLFFWSVDIYINFADLLLQAKLTALSLIKRALLRLGEIQ
jgi:hypothetical protein